MEQCDLESLYLDDSQVDLSFVTKSSSLAKLKHLEVDKSIISLPDGVNLLNLQELRLDGSGCIKNCLERLGKGL